MTRISVRELGELSEWALRAGGVAPGEARIAASAVVAAEVLFGVGVDGLSHSLNLLDHLDPALSKPSVDPDGIVTDVQDLGVVVRCPRVAMAVAGSVPSLQLVTHWHASMVGSLMEASTATGTDLMAIGFQSDGSVAGWATATSVGVGLFGEGETPPEVALHRTGTVPAIVIKRADRGSDSWPEAGDVTGWDAITERRRIALVDGLTIASKSWVDVTDRAHALLVPEGSS